MIHFYISSRRVVYASLHLAPSCVITGSMDGLVVDCSRYLSYFHVINQSEYALQTNQS